MAAPIATADAYFKQIRVDETLPPDEVLEAVVTAEPQVKKLSKWEWLIYVLIVGNTVTMCLIHEGQSEEFTYIVEMSNYFFTACFSVEMLVKLVANGCGKYFESGWNTFDFFVTWCSLIDLLMEVYGHETDVLRAMRVARVLRLLRLNNEMRRFELTIVKAADKVVNLSGILVLCIIVYALLGMELFGGKLGEEPMRTNFDYFSNAFITVFVVTSGENWNDVYGGTLPYSGGPLSVLYFVPLFILTNYVLVNLFVAIISWGWETAAEDLEDPEEKMASEEKKAEVEKLRAELASALTALRSAHTNVLLELQELIGAKQLGFSAASGSRLMARMGQLFKDFESAADQAGPDELKGVAGLTLGFASMVKGLGELLDDAASLKASAELSLLLEYWESEHARMSGALPSVPGKETIAKLTELLKKYATTITANRVLMSAVASLRAQERAKRDARGPRFKVDAESAPEVDPDFAVVPFKSDAPGAAFLPLTLDMNVSAFHRQLRAILTHPNFDNFIIFIIVLSSLSLSLDMPTVAPDSQLAISLDYSDKFFTIIFVIEASLKLMTFGLYGEEGYFTSYWNILDFSIVTTSVISILSAGAEGFGVFKALRAIRTLRPLRVIQRFKGLKMVVNSLFRAIPAVLNVGQVCFLVLIVYGLFGMTFLMGRLGHCNDDMIGAKVDCVGTFTDESGEEKARWWGNPDVANFDSIGYAMLTLFEMSTLEMWPDVMFLAMDSDPTATGQPLVQNQNAWMAVYIISWIVISAFLLLNLFVGVVLENFNAIRQAEDGSGFLSDDQKEWSKTLQNVLSVRAEKMVRTPFGKNCFARFRRAIFMLVQGDRENRAVPIAFEKFIISLVILNVLAMSLTYYGQPEYMSVFSDYCDIFFTVAFTTEMVLKITGLGLRQYLMSGWNVFDGTLVTIALAADALQGLESLGVKIDPGTVRMLRVFRIARLLRLMKMGGGLNRLITTIVIAVPALANVGVLLILFLYIYTILGIELFHNLPLDGDFINYDANFGTFGTAMLTLFRCITGESYNGIMHDAMVTEAHSEPGRCSDAEGTCGSPITAVVFFISFIVIEAMVMLNLIVAVVLDTFAEEEAAEEMKLSPSQIENFVDAWKELDPDATHFMPTKDLKKLLLLLDAPLGYRDTPPADSATRTEHLKSLEVPDRAGSIAFHDALEAFGKKAFGSEIELPQGTDVLRNITKQYGEVFKSTALHKTVVSQYSSAYIYAVIRMQNAFRKKLARKKMLLGLSPNASLPKGGGGGAKQAAPPKRGGPGAPKSGGGRKK